MNPRTLPPPATLDKWDIAFIRHFKQAGPLSMNTLMTIWAERVGMEVDPISFRAYVVEYLANLIDRLNLTPDLYKVLNDMNPAKGWRYGIPDGASYHERLILVMGAWLCHTEVRYLPGYAEAITLLEISELADKLKGEAIQEEQEEETAETELDADSEKDGSADYHNQT